MAIPLYMTRLKNFREINNLAIPLIISSMSGTILALLDQAIIGHISIYAYAGVGLVTSIINSITGVLGVLSVSFNILGSKSKGINDIEDINYKFNTCILFNIFIGIIMFLLILFGGNFILSTIFGLTGEALNESSNFIKVYSLTIGLNLIIFTYNTIFKIFRKTTNILKVCIVVNVIGVLVDYTLVFGKFGFPQLGSLGASIASFVVLIFSGFFPRLITNDQTLIYSFKSYILLCIIINLFNIIKTIYKSSLQSIDKEIWVVRENFVVNLVTLIFMFALKEYGLIIIYSIFGVNYLYLSIRFYYKYKFSLT